MGPAPFGLLKTGSCFSLLVSQASPFFSGTTSPRVRNYFSKLSCMRTAIPRPRSKSSVLLLPFRYPSRPASSISTRPFCLSAHTLTRTHALRCSVLTLLVFRVPLSTLPWSVPLVHVSVSLCQYTFWRFGAVGEVPLKQLRSQ